MVGGNEWLKDGWEGGGGEKVGWRTRRLFVEVSEEVAAAVANVVDVVVVVVVVEVVMVVVM